MKVSLLMDTSLCFGNCKHLKVNLMFLLKMLICKTVLRYLSLWVFHTVALCCQFIVFCIFLECGEVSKKSFCKKHQLLRSFISTLNTLHVLIQDWMNLLILTYYLFTTYLVKWKDQQTEKSPSRKLFLRNILSSQRYFLIESHDFVYIYPPSKQTKKKKTGVCGCTNWEPRLPSSLSVGRSTTSVESGLEDFGINILV